MYIEPSTNIKLLHNVPLDTTYDHTIYFEDGLSQYNYFSNLTKYDLASYSYQRVRRGYARVGIVADNLYDCNYMMFRNINFGQKWFYAFIKSVEYINNECSEIQFEIDVMQTWLFDFTLDQCFIERNHTVTDVPGQNITPEPVECGEYVLNGEYSHPADIDELCVVVGTIDTDGNTVSGKNYGGIYGGLSLRAFYYDDTQGINDYLATFVQKMDNVVTIYTMPVAFLPGADLTGGYDIPDISGVNLRKIVELEPIKAGDQIDHHLPKNNKLYTYPYNYLHVDNASGESLSLRYEFFDGNTPRLKIYGSITQPVKAVCYPAGYKNVPKVEIQGGEKEYGALNTESLSLTNYPLCSWNVDSFQAWIAQNALPIATSLIGTAIGAGAMFIPGIGAGIAGAGVATSTALAPQYLHSNIPMSGGGSGVEPLVQQNAINNITGLLTQGYKASIAADVMKGSINTGNVNCSSRRQDFWVGRMSITQQYAEMIDDFFTRYGYAIHAIGVPNISSRPHWNYIKTVGCTVSGSVPCDDMRKICQIFDGGITFWKNGNEIGNYSLDNSPS